MSCAHVHAIRPGCSHSWKQQPLSLMASRSRVRRQQGVVVPTTACKQGANWSKRAWKVHTRVCKCRRKRQTPLLCLVFVFFFLSASPLMADVSTSADRSNRPRNDISIMTWKLFWFWLFSKHGRDSAASPSHFERLRYWATTRPLMSAGCQSGLFCGAGAVVLQEDIKRKETGR